LVSWQDLVALLILILQGAKLRHQVLSLVQPATQDELIQVANKLNSRLAGRTSQEMRGELESLSGRLEQQVAEATIKMLEAPEPTHRELRWEGMRHFLGQPEFSNNRQAQEVMEVLEEPSAWQDLISQILRQEGVHVFIGMENRQDALRNCSVVLSRYGRPGGAMGVVGILGPTRMPYQRAVGSVRYLASVMGDLVQELGI
jgi:heat-inducible transcriptional repressor